MLKGGRSTSMVPAGLLAASLIQRTVAAPIVPPVTTPALANGRSLEQVYYYHGRHYRYHYHSGYYAHRVYRHGHWHYY
jgi:hypothetical protein